MNTSNTNKTTRPLSVRIAVLKLRVSGINNKINADLLTLDTVQCSKAYIAIENNIRKLDNRHKALSIELSTAQDERRYQKDMQTIVK